mmetsp:Transcript_16747/g.29219  ORF Transcript_16747/g.29219 Transcript_16747/m.29219 type:complete len:284 (-) Transcript_16747:749-1600(-)
MKLSVVHARFGCVRDFEYPPCFPEATSAVIMLLHAVIFVTLCCIAICNKSSHRRRLVVDKISTDSILMCGKRMTSSDLSSVSKCFVYILARLKVFQELLSIYFRCLDAGPFSNSSIQLAFSNAFLEFLWSAVHSKHLHDIDIEKKIPIRQKRPRSIHTIHTSSFAVFEVGCDVYPRSLVIDSTDRQPIQVRGMSIYWIMQIHIKRFTVPIHSTIGRSIILERWFQTKQEGFGCFVLAVPAFRFLPGAIAIISKRIPLGRLYKNGRCSMIAQQCLLHGTEGTSI